MRQFVLLVAAVVLFGIGTQAQESSSNSPLSISPFGKSSETTAAVALPSSFSFSSSSSNSTVPPSASADSNDSASPGPPQVFGVRPTYNMQGYVGYTFVDFFELPNLHTTTNGFNYSMIFYPDQLKGIIGADGEFVLTFGSQYPYRAAFLLGLGGVRARWKPFSRNIEIWGHGLFGGSHATPQTPYGSQGAFAYELGGGVDFNLRRERYAFRVGADMVSTHFFGTYQFSPKFSTGFVYKF